MHHTKKYRASTLTDKKKSNSVRRRKKNIEQTENLPTPPIKNQMVCPLYCYDSSIYNFRNFLFLLAKSYIY
jgi:hypothetical protein